MAAGERIHTLREALEPMERRSFLLGLSALALPTPVLATPWVSPYQLITRRLPSGDLAYKLMRDNVVVSQWWPG